MRKSYRALKKLGVPALVDLAAMRDAIVDEGGDANKVNPIYPVDLVLTITQKLRKYGVVCKYIQFYGSGALSLSVADRATIANMAPEYGATFGLLPIDDKVIDYLTLTNRASTLIVDLT